MKNDNEENLPEGIAISWGLSKPPQRGPKRELSTEQIVAAAIKIADEEGLSAVSMNRVAASLGFTPMSLYRYIPSKDDLLLLMQDQACFIDFPSEQEPMDWRQKMREYVHMSLKIFQAHPWLGEIPISGVPMTPNQLKLVDLALHSTSDLHLKDNERMSIVLLLSGYARWCGTLLKDVNNAIRSGKSQDTISGKGYTSVLKKLVTPERYPDLYPVLMSGAYTEDNEEANSIENDFDFGLERLLDGIAHYLIFRPATK